MAARKTQKKNNNEPVTPKKGNTNMFYNELTTGGRPTKILNAYGLETVEKLASMQCTDEEIASVLDISVDTLTNKNNGEAFTDAKKRGKEKGKVSIRRMQYKSAEKGSVPMLIWLGKQYLGQKDQQDVTLSEASVSINVKPASEAKVDFDD